MRGADKSKERAEHVDGMQHSLQARTKCETITLYVRFTLAGAANWLYTALPHYSLIRLLHSPSIGGDINSALVSHHLRALRSSGMDQNLKGNGGREIQAVDKQRKVCSEQGVRYNM